MKDNETNWILIDRIIKNIGVDANDVVIPVFDLVSFGTDLRGWVDRGYIIGKSLAAERAARAIENRSLFSPPSHPTTYDDCVVDFDDRAARRERR